MNFHIFLLVYLKKKSLTTIITTVTDPVQLVLVSSSVDSGITIAVTLPVGALPITVEGVEGGVVDFSQTLETTSTIIFTNARLVVL